MLNKYRKNAARVLVLLAALSCVVTAQAQNLVYVAHGGGNVAATSGGEIGTIDLDTGVYTALAPSYGSLTGLVSDGSYLYTYETQSASILTIDPYTGAVVNTAAYSGALPPTDLARDPSTGIVYGPTTEYRFVSIDVTTGIATDLGSASTGSGGYKQLAFSTDGTLYLHATNAPSQFHTVDPADGSILTTVAGGVPGGALGLAYDASTGLLVASECCNAADGSLGERIWSVDPASGTANLLWDLDDGRRIQDFAFLDQPDPGANALFRVTKSYPNGLDEAVDVMITCNSGLPLEQTATIDPDNNVTFVLTEFVEGTECTVTETSSPDNYTPLYNGVAGDGCTFTDITNAYYGCGITNQPDDASLTVTKEWLIQDDYDSAVVLTADLQVRCSVDFDGASYDGLFYRNYTLNGETDSVTVTGIGTHRPDDANWCYVIETGEMQTGVETENGCGTQSDPIVFSPASEEACTITNTVFYEGIPTLNQYGMALMALLMLGIGFVGFRRFV